MLRLKIGLKSVPATVVAQIGERTGGVPLFVEEFAKVVQEGAGIREIDGELELATSVALRMIPSSLQDLLMARLDRMDADREVVQIAATLGREFSHELIGAVSTMDASTLQQELLKLVKAEILFQRGQPPQTTYWFKHALIQDAAYQSLLTKKQQQIHKTIATILEQRFAEKADEKPEKLAHHFTEAGLYEQGAVYWRKAGLRAQSHSANQEAISHLTRGLEVVEKLAESPERDQLELSLQAPLGVALTAARGWGAPEVAGTIERARELCAKVGTPTDQFFVMWGLWGFRLLRLELQECQQLARAVMPLVEESAECHELAFEAHWIPGCTAFYAGDFGLALESFEKGLSEYDVERARTYSLKTGQNVGVLYQCHRALVLWELGFPEQALAQAQQMIDFARRLAHPFSLAMGLYFRRRLFQYCRFEDEAQQNIEEEYAICHEHGFAFWKAHALLARGALLVQQGRFDEARQLLDPLLDLLQASGCKCTLTHPFSFLAESFLNGGRVSEALEWLERGFDLVENHGERCLESELLRLKGECLLAQSAVKTDAEAAFIRAIDVARQQSAKSRQLRTTMSLCRLMRIQARHEEATRMLDEILAEFREGLATPDLIAAKELLGELRTGR
jgi:tetratricopeptide (TPR) repeat protein